MMNTRVVLCLLLLAGSLAGAQNTTTSAHETETLLIALENGWNQAQLHHDSKALDEMASVITSKAANGYHFKTGQEATPRT